MRKGNTIRNPVGPIGQACWGYLNNDLIEQADNAGTLGVEDRHIGGLVKRAPRSH